MTTNTISQTIVDTVSTWEEVTIAPHRFGGIEFRVRDFYAIFPQTTQHLDDAIKD